LDRPFYASIKLTLLWQFRALGRSGFKPVTECAAEELADRGPSSG
jgi:hypothetical protein